MSKTRDDNGQLEDAEAQPRKKTECGVTRGYFAVKAKSIPVTIAGNVVVAKVKQFSTGSFGFGAQDKITVDVDGTPVKCQVSLNITVIGSKDAE